ncbi:MAG: type II secretion system protein [Acidobacteria bacterium]|nr:type II secretion system protein [Acidobacteriota bacterium]
MYLRQSKPISEKGFTLIELVISIVLVGIIAGVLVPIIFYGTEGYRQQVARKELVNRARLALERMSRELREAVPNSVRVSTVNASNDTLEFGRAIFFSHYSSITGGSSPYTLNDDTGLAVPSASFIVIYNVSPDDFYAYPSSPSTFSVAGVSGNQVSINASAKPHSSTKRYQMCESPVTYARNTSGELIRYFGYAPGEDYKNSAADQNILIDHVSSIRFQYSSGTLSNTALLTILMQVKAGGETMNFHQEVHIRNVP